MFCYNDSFMYPIISTKVRCFIKDCIQFIKYDQVASATQEVFLIRSDILIGLRSDRIINGGLSNSIERKGRIRDNSRRKHW